ncbi:MAG TPA: hypothetical protein VF889_02240 [Bacteroidota bacterium]
MNAGRFARGRPLWLLPLLLLLLPGCGLFQTRTPDAPTEPSDSFRPSTDPDALIENLQSAIAQKNTVNYERCFASATQGRQPFVFTPSSSALAAYPGVFARWTVDEERQYFQNLVARAAGKPNAYSNLTLTHKTIIVSGDSAVYSYDYTLVFEHNDPSFPTTAIGTMQVTMGPDQNNAWVINRWTDYKTSSEVTWSHFKGKFSN